MLRVGSHRSDPGPRLRPAGLFTRAPELHVHRGRTREDEPPRRRRGACFGSEGTAPTRDSGIGPPACLPEPPSGPALPIATLAGEPRTPHEPLQLRATDRPLQQWRLRSGLREEPSNAQKRINDVDLQKSEAPPARLLHPSPGQEEQAAPPISALLHGFRSRRRSRKMKKAPWGFTPYPGQC